MNAEEKINTLKKIADEFNHAGITWALGASMLLYFKGIVDEFHDIDIMVMTEDVELVKRIMNSLHGELQPPNPNSKYNTEVFLEYTVADVEVDIMAGFRINKDGKVYDCSLQPDQIVEKIDLDGIEIPLQSIQLWHKYYELMGRINKVERINKRSRKNANE